MAVHIKLIKNNIKSSSSYGKYFANNVIPSISYHFIEMLLSPVNEGYDGGHQ